MRHEQEVDTQLAELWGREQELRRLIDRDLLYLHHALDDDRVNGRSGTTRGFRYDDRRQFASTDAQIEDSAREQVAAGTLGLRVRGSVESTLRGLDSRRIALARVRELAQPLEADFAEHRWSRFFLVLNPNGHIHRSMSCSTCRPTTRFGWQPELSGLTEREAVEALGPKLCSVCYPSAPVEWIAKGRGA